MRLHRRFGAVLAVFLALTTSSAALAALPGRWGGGLMLGIAKPSGQGLGLQYGLELNAPLGSVISLVAFFHKTAQSVGLTNGTTVVDLSQGLTYLGGGASYHFSPMFSGGLKVGIASTSAVGTATDGTSTVTVSTDASGLFFQPHLIYELPISASFSYGGELGYAFSLNSAVGGSITLLGFLKFWY